MSRHRERSIKIAHSLYYNIPSELVSKVYSLGFINMNHKRSKAKALTLCDRAAFLGSNPHNFIPKEWRITGAEHSSTPSSCICGQSGIKNRYIVSNIVTNISVSVGGSCLETHFKLNPKDELIGFSKNYAEPYVWLGSKYNAFIFYVLGFRKSYLYFQCRTEGKTVSSESNRLLRDKLSQSIYTFNFLKWRKGLSRGERLLKRIRSDRMKRKKKNLPPFDPEKNQADIEAIALSTKKLASVIVEGKTALESENMDEILLAIRTSNHIVARAELQHDIANGLKYKIRKPFSSSLLSAQKIVRKLNNKRSLLQAIDFKSQAVQRKYESKIEIEEGKEQRDKNFIDLLLVATEDRINHPVGSDFKIMGDFIKDKLPTLENYSSKELLKQARDHLHQVRSKVPIVKDLISQRPLPEWEMILRRISEDDSLGMISLFSKSIVRELVSQTEHMDSRQKVLWVMGTLNRAKQSFVSLNGKGENGQSSRVIEDFIDNISEKIIKENLWIIKQLKNI